MAVSHRPIDSAPVIRRIVDKAGTKVDLDRIKASSDAAELQSWRDDQEWEEAPSDDEEAAINTRLAELAGESGGSAAPVKQGPSEEEQAAARRAVEERLADEFRAEFEKAARLSSRLTNFDPAVARLLVAANLSKQQVGQFFARCGDQNLVPSAYQPEIWTFSKKEHSRRAGIGAFAAGATPDQVKALTVLDDSCVDEVKENFDVDTLVSLIEQKVLTISKNTYRVTRGTGANGAVYRFEVAGFKALGPIGAEWHVHFGVRDVAQNPGFKHKSAGKQSARVSTNDQTNAKLKAAFGSLWGVKV